MNIFFVSSEVAPFSKTGGLGDVCGALPAALAKRGHRVVTISPNYGVTDDSHAWDVGSSFWVWLFGGHHEARFKVQEDSDHLAHVLVDNPMYARMGIYGDHHGFFGDNLLRYAFLSRVALEVPRFVPIWGERSGVADVFHAHDWHTGLVPLYLNANHKPLGVYPGCRSVLTIHNANYQGDASVATFGALDLAPRHLDTLKWGDGISLMKGGVVSADHVTAVSPTFADELCTPEGSFGLESVFSAKRSAGQMQGILNGIDTDSWNPATDPAIEANFDEDHLDGKLACKRAIQREMGLPERDVPLLIIVSRLVQQKGIDALLDGAAQILSRDLQLVVLGSGDLGLESALRGLEGAFPTKARSWIGFDVALSRRLYAAADICLVPSLFEPCGLTQMYAMRYGAVPVVRATGGLRDTVWQWHPDTQTGTGWTFDDLTGEALANSIDHAIATWYDHPESFATIRRNGMSRDWSWDRAAEAYEAVYVR